MSNLRTYVVLFGLGCLPAAVSTAADTRQKTIHVEAVVTKYEVGAMEDAFEDRFVAYDGVTLRMLSPGELADTRLCVYIRCGSLPENSPFTKPGQRCRFDFDTESLKDHQLFAGVLENLQWITVDVAAEGTDAEKKMRPIDASVLAVIERELSRLERDATRETGPNLPEPSKQVAYYLLAGLARQGVPFEDVPKDELRLLGAPTDYGKLVSVFADVRVSLTDHVVQDRSATYILKHAKLYVQRDGKWSQRGITGTIAALPTE